MNTATSERLIETTVKPISRRPPAPPHGRRLARSMCAGDVLDDDDRIVDDEARRDGQRHQREVVEAVAEQIHHPERADQRQRDGDAGDDGGRGLRRKANTTRTTSMTE